MITVETVELHECHDVVGEVRTDETEAEPSKFHIYARTGIYMGTWEGSSPAEALLAMHHARGHADKVKMYNGRLCFFSHLDRLLLGDVNSWEIVQDKDSPNN